MKPHTIEGVRLKRLLIALSLLIAAIVALDALPGRPATDADTAVTDVLAKPPEVTEPPESTLPPETTKAETTTETTVPETKTENQAPPDPGLRVTILGTCAPGSPLGTTAYGSFNATMDREGADYFLASLAPLFEADDLTLAANACVFTAAGDSYSCAADGDSAEIYAAASVEMVTLGSPLFTGDAQSDTETHLHAANVAMAPARTVQYTEKDGVRLAIYTTTLKKAESVEEDLSAIRTAAEEADHVLVCFWGVDTYSASPEEWLSYNLYRFADAGADLIVGGGCPVLRPMETYGNATIVYSLGNLLDGTSFASGASAILSVHLSPKGEMTLDVLPCGAGANRWQPTILPNGDEKNQILAILQGDGQLPRTDR